MTRFDEDLVDWERTTCWAWGGYYGRVFLNVKGREPQGTIAPEDYERVRDELIERIKAVPDPEGRPMKTTVVRPQDIYTGPFVDDAPDLMVYMDDLNWRLGQDLGNEDLYAFDTEIGPDDSVHDYCGMIAARVPGDTQLRLGDPSHLMDVAPTVLELLGVPVPEHMEGRSLV
jgi:predicted AlkP superfamily phosphohydrolase/phosphomutase